MCLQSKCISAADHPNRLILFRRFVSRTAASNGRAVLEGVGLESETIAACFNSHPLNEEEAVQAGLIKWSEGQGSKPATWNVLFAAMDYAQIGQKHVNSLKKELDLFGMQYVFLCVCMCACMCMWDIAVHNGVPCSFIHILCISLATHVTARVVRVIH